MPPATDRLVRNNFDLLRLVLAGMVALVHVGVLSGEPALAWIPHLISSDLAVKSFFIVSGFLIVMSYERSSGWPIYAAKRFRRIFPGYVVVILTTAVALVLVSRVPAADYFSTAFWQYIGANVVFLNFLKPTLPGVFEGNVLPTVNGALWTLKIEVAFYALVPAIVWLSRRYGRATVLAVIYLASVGYVAWMQALAVANPTGPYDTLAYQLPGQLSYFTAGAAAYYAFEVFERHWRPFVTTAAGLLVIDSFYPVPVIEPAALGVLIIAAATIRYLGPFGRYGDFSYGLYILHFPLIQVLAQSGIAEGQPVAFLAIALALPLAGAILLWHGVEKRWLLPTSHYRGSA